MELHCIELIDELEEHIEKGKKSLVGNRVSVEKETIMILLDELKEILPTELVHANDFYRDSRKCRDEAEKDADSIIDQANREANDIVNKAQGDAELIIEDARNEAHSIISAAKEKQSQMVNEHQITVLANEKAEQIVLQAGKKASDIKEATMRYLDDKLSYASEVLGRTYHEIEDNRKSL